METRLFTIGSEGLRLRIALDGGGVRAELRSGAGEPWADGALQHHAETAVPEGTLRHESLRAPTVSESAGAITVRGTLAGLSLTQVFTADPARAAVDERITVRNEGTAPVSLLAFHCGLTREVTDFRGNVPPALKNDRIAGIPFLHRAIDPGDFDLSFSIEDLLRLAGREVRSNEGPFMWPMWGFVPGPGWESEGWAWERGGAGAAPADACGALGVYKLNQDGMEKSIVRARATDGGAVLVLGGAAMHSGGLDALRSVAPGQEVALGITRYQAVANDRREAWYGFRSFLDEHGCRYPEGFDPPVHWNELYDNPEWNLGSPGAPPKGPTRPVTYTLALIEEEAKKAVAYGCQTLYLDPGWDTAFGTFLWGEQWLGPRRAFVRLMKEKYGLKVALHCPLATWMSLDSRGVSAWPAEALQVRKDGSVVQGAYCQGSRQYMDLAAERLLACCDDGVSFLMFDGNWYNGGCWNPAHGHPVPYTLEAHANAQIDLARRVHAKHPHVLIEQHDPVSGGVLQRHSPVYWKHGLPGSFDENWGFELMWQPMEDIRTGRARALYWYNLSCNVPVYLHIDLRDDNEHCLVLWWYASTCRHLGIGGTHPSPRVAAAQREAMVTYRRLDRFYKRGAFFGMGENVHAHVLRDEGAFVVNLFNCSDEERVVEGTASVARMGLDPDRWYVCPKGGRFDRTAGTFVISRRMPAWSTSLAEVTSIRS